MFLNAKPLFQGEALEVMENSKNCRVQGQHITSQVGTNEPGHPLTDTIAAWLGNLSEIQLFLCISELVKE